MSLIVSLLITCFYAWFSNWLFLPAMNIRSCDFWIWGISILAVFAVVNIAVGYLLDDDRTIKVFTGSITIAIILFVIELLALFFGSCIFNASAYSNLVDIEQVEFTDVIKSNEKIDDIALMDTSTARMFGERTLGELSDLVSVYDVEEKYTTIAYNGKPMKVASLCYDGFFKYTKNNVNGIPGYIMVDPVNNSSKYIKVEDGIHYAPSAYFSHDLKRHLRNCNPTALFEDPFFEIDEEGHPYWVAPIYKPTINIFSAKLPTGAIIMDATTGICKTYAMEDIPEWVDIVVDGYTICKYYDYKGTLSNGFWNSQFAQNGCTETTSDFGYKIIGNDVYIYTGITSCNNSSSATAFLLANSRTGEIKTMTLPGCDEASAMQAAEGEVSDYGWIASFPSIVNINGEPAYMMVLKDENGIVKRYALVNIKSYNIVAVDSTQKKVLAKYSALLAGEDEEEAEAAAEAVEEEPKAEIPENTETKTIVISNVQFIVNGGNTTVYIADTEGNYYKMAFDEFWITVKESDEVSITYVQDTISTIYTIN